MSTLAVSLIRCYQYVLSPLVKIALGGGWWGCRYVPTCSRYCQQVVRQYGLRVGFVLFLKRLSRCHPWGGSGYDPLPSTNNEFGANIRIRTFVQNP